MEGSTSPPTPSRHDGRSPPSSPTLFPIPTAESDGAYRPPHADVGIDAFGNSEEEVGSDAFDHSSNSDFSWEGRAHSVQAWVSPGNYDVLDRLLFAFINPPILVVDVNPTLRAALASVEPHMPVEFLPSTRGA